MASLEFRPRGGYRIVFRFNGKKRSKTLETRCDQTAHLALAQFELNLRRLRLGKFVIEPGEDLVDALLSDHPRQSSRSTKKTRPRRARRSKKKIKSTELVSFGAVLDKYLANIRDGSIETNTRRMLEIHVRHLKRVIGEHVSVRQIDNDCLQAYIDARSDEPGRRDKKVSPTTIRKEISTLTTVWKWAFVKKIVSQPLVKDRLQYGKVTQPPPFQTVDQIKRRISRGSLSTSQIADLWDCLFLTLPEIDELLTQRYCQMLCFRRRVPA